MKGILADANIQGYVDYLIALVQAEPWKLFWDDLGIQYRHFSDVGLAPEAADSLVWETCQQEELVLVTDNRNRPLSTLTELTAGRSASASGPIAGRSLPSARVISMMCSPPNPAINSWGVPRAITLPWSTIATRSGSR